ncbi:hypothetical protein [Mycolicibacterium llatzerense]|uniref:hypothetical protein n=1 Tax=Mycolicibacterium llatzerense TaxID=280871 RepID=UPI0005C6A820|nr:hypothetical protein [Mycolicibacterium llatzerense]
MGSNYAPNPGTAIDTATRPAWQRTGHDHFPYAANQSGHWWVLRANYGFPEHDLYTLFVDGQAVADITANPYHPLPLLASIGALRLTDPDPAVPMLDDDVADADVGAVASYVNYGSEHDDPCLFCSGES